jgi:thiol:disulfide interchange protein
MKELFALFAQIALSRKGPQDLPASSLVLLLTMAGYALIRYVVSAAMPPTDQWRLHLVIEIGFTLAWYAVLLRTLGKPERFLQTVTAIFGYELVLAPVWIVAIYLSERVKPEDALYVPVVLLALALAIWIIRAGSYVLKAALELPIAVCVVLTILQIFAGELLMRALSPPQAVATTIETIPT